MRLPISALLLRYLGRLRFPTLMKLSAVLFVIALFTPIPLADELIFGLATLLFASWRKHSSEKDAIAGSTSKDGRVIEHEPPRS